MRLSWRDAVTTLLIVFIGIVFYLWATGTDLVIISETQGTLFVIGLAGLAMWFVGATRGDLGANWFTGAMVVLAVAAGVFFVVGLITLEAWTVAALAIDLAAMWLIDLMYREYGAPTHVPTHV